MDNIFNEGLNLLDLQKENLKCSWKSAVHFDEISFEEHYIIIVIS